ncbi:MAG: hypothetical protein R6X34_22740 [Chloroflexota bacterium]
MMRKIGALICLSMVVFVVGCTMGSVEEAAVIPDLPTPTTHPLFQNEAAAAQSPTPDPGLTPSPTAVFTEVLSGPGAFPDKEGYLQALTGLTYSDLITKTVYDDALDVNWELLPEEGMDVDLESMAHVRNGRYAIAMTPLDTWQRLYFAVRQDAAVSFPANDVLAISFWLNGGSDYIELHDLAFTVVGSNDYPYWVEGDRSAYYDDEFPFSETALYHLDLNGSIPPNTWVQVEVYIHELIYDPDYRFITGFYLKNADDFFNTVYVDDINIITLPLADGDEPAPVNDVEAAETTTPPEITVTVTPTATVAITPTTPISQETACVVSPPDGWERYTIQAGDVLSNISLERNVAVDRVASVNCLGSDAVLSINRSIWLPALVPSENAAETPAPTN